ncbi:MAG: ATP synthase F0 subunit C [Cyanobacteria bacterium]|nr:ATP synthase F0 subunit C [Cyanobacteriota bacterium]
MDLSSALLGGPLAVGLASIGPGIGIGLLSAAFFNSVARQPEVQGKLQPLLFTCIAFIELLGLLGFVAYFLFAFKIAPIVQ